MLHVIVPFKWVGKAMLESERTSLDGEAALAALADLPDLVCVCQDNAIQWMNRAGLNLLNAANYSDVVGKPFVDFLAPDYAALGPELYSLLVDENAPVETKIQGLNGATHDCELSVLAHLNDSTGAGMGRYIVHARNISEFTRIAETLHLREHYLRDLINNSLSLICECRDGIVRFINRSGIEMLGADSESEIIGKPIQDLFHRSYQDIFSSEFQAILNEDAFIPIRLRRLDDTYMDVDVAFTSLGGEGVTNFLAEAHDITDHNRAVINLRDSIEMLEVRVEERTESLQQEITTRRNAEKQMRYLATHDALTGLPNRSLLRDRLGDKT